MIAAPFGQLFIPVKRDKWLTGCVPILYGAKCSAEFWNELGRAFYILGENILTAAMPKDAVMTHEKFGQKRDIGD